MVYKANENRSIFAVFRRFDKAQNQFSIGISNAFRQIQISYSKFGQN